MKRVPGEDFVPMYSVSCMVVPEKAPREGLSALCGWSPGGLRGVPVEG